MGFTPVIDVSGSGSAVNIPSAATPTVIHSKSFSAGTYLVSAKITFKFSSTSTQIPTGGSAPWLGGISLTSGFDTSEDASPAVSYIDNSVLRTLYPSGTANTKFWTLNMDRHLKTVSTGLIYLVASYPTTLVSGAIEALGSMTVTRIA
jgi:hypothetical protein